MEKQWSWKFEEYKDLSSLALDELIGNLKVHEVVMEKDSEIYKGKKERIKSITLKAKKESSDDETSTSRIEESLNVTFDESPPPTKLSPLVDDDVGEEEAIRKNTKKPKNVNEALKDESWVVAMQEDLNQFVANDVWELVPLPISQSVIGTKWVFRNKLDENGIVSRNKARLVAQGYNQQEGIDYDETYAPTTGRYNNYAVLPSIPCPKECKIVAQLLVDHALSYALTATTDVLAIKEITYTVDMFRSTLKLPVETPTHQFIAPNVRERPIMRSLTSTSCISSAVLKDSQAVVNANETIRFKVDTLEITYTIDMFRTTLKLPQKKDVIQYPRFTKLIIADLMQNSDSIPKRLKEEYHSIKDDVPLVSVYTTRNVTIKGMLIPDEFLTDDIHATLEYKDFEKTPSADMTSTPATIVDDAVQNKKRKQVVRETGSLRKIFKGPSSSKRN
ncbi:retrovirus-related pol polyprotein from transposon TNT 1-94 [Tanacetum coccineum]|uniref:Retrovirus-related pol polyprotein from transposon TNT 1-94 n=1 Tax=Tanacetum coccineum TaxID=301880 RepID=A0ABQ5ICP5_9ASTR